MKTEQIAKIAKEVGVFITPRTWLAFRSLSSSEKGDLISILLGIDVPNATERVKTHIETFLVIMECNHRETLKARIAEERNCQQSVKLQGEAMAHKADDKLALLDEFEKELETEFGL